MKSAVVSKYLVKNKNDDADIIRSFLSVGGYQRLFLLIRCDEVIWITYKKSNHAPCYFIRTVNRKIC